jgi:hypothetical protein
MTTPAHTREGGGRGFPGIYRFNNYWIGLTEQGGIKQYIAMAKTGRVWFVTSSPPVEKVD